MEEVRERKEKEKYKFAGGYWAIAFEMRRRISRISLAQLSRLGRKRRDVRSISHETLQRSCPFSSDESRFYTRLNLVFFLQGFPLSFTTLFPLSFFNRLAFASICIRVRSGK